MNNPKPEAANCDGMFENVAVLTITAGEERQFTREYVFMKFETITGCQAKLKLIFPKQDLQDAKLAKTNEANK